MKKFILLSAGVLLLASCSNESAFQEEIVTASVVADKIGICHNGENKIVISENAVETHQAHGDAVDKDGDGFYDKDNSCSATDLDDTIPFDQSTLVDADGDGFFTTQNPFSDIDCDDTLAFDQSTLKDIDGDGFYDIDNPCSATDLDDTIPFDQSTLVDADGDGFFTTQNPFSVIDCDDTSYSLDNSCGPSLAIGDTYQGGIIAYILQPGDPGYVSGQKHGLIAAPYDQSNGAIWGCYDTAISGADGKAIGTGYQNTLDIINGCNTPGIAAKICDDLDLDGYADWYLPSIDELQKLHDNQEKIGGFGSTYYWSSSEYFDHPDYPAFYEKLNARVRGFGGYPSNVKAKNANWSVRAVRSF